MRSLIAVLPGALAKRGLEEIDHVGVASLVELEQVTVDVFIVSETAPAVGHLFQRACFPTQLHTLGDLCAVRPHAAL